MVRVRQPGYRERDHEYKVTDGARPFRIHVYVRERTQAARSHVSACRRTTTFLGSRLSRSRACALRPIDRPARPARTPFLSPLISGFLRSYQAKNPKYSILKNLRHILSVDVNDSIARRARAERAFSEPAAAPDRGGAALETFKLHLDTSVALIIRSEWVPLIQCI